ncbi:uncharacterized protein LOC134264415 [Saccostrea cucullata]|uniref:uncharacterized protein LOC134264415 n=1 Tax=Saccostrea cuccullata TaxID=36930 RepID=UPI002ED44BA6
MGNTAGKFTQSGRKKTNKNSRKEAICTPSRCDTRRVYEHEESTCTAEVIQDRTSISLSVRTVVSSNLNDPSPSTSSPTTSSSASSPSTSSPHGSNSGQSTPPSWPLTRQQSVNAQAAMGSSAPHYEATSGTINFCLLARILLDVCSDAMRDLLRCKIKGGEVILTQKIYQKRNKLNKLKNLHDAQKKLIMPPNNELVRYNSLDFSLMYTIMRNVCPSQIESDSSLQDKWGKFPDANDLSLLAALERIRHCRNDFFAHNTSAKVNDTDFNEIWLQVEVAVKKIDENLDPSIVGICYIDEMRKLKENPNIDPKTTSLFQHLAILEKQLIEAYEMTVETDIKLEELLYERKKCRKTIWGTSRSKLQVDMYRPEDPNIAQTEHYLAGFVKENHYYVETRVYQDIEKFLKENRCAIIVGKQGTGKTEIANHLMLKNLKDFVVRKLKRPHEFGSLVNPKKKQMFFIDNIFDCSDSDLADWWKSFDYIQELVGSKSDHQTSSKSANDESDTDDEGPEFITYVVMTTRPNALNVARAQMRKNHSLLKDYVLDISSDRFTLSNKEKRLILEAKIKYAKHVKKIEEHSFSPEDWRSIFKSTPPFGYPLCARLFACDKIYRRDGPEFFSNPHRYLVSRLKKIIEEDISGRTGMLFVLLLVSDIQKVTLQYDDDEQCWEILSDLDLTQELSLKKKAVKNLPEAAAEHLEVYLRESDGVYKFIHPSVGEAVENYFVEKYTNKAIEILPMHILFKKMNLEDKEDKCLPLLTPNLLESLAERLLRDIIERKGNICEICKYDGLKNKNFSVVFLKQITKDTHCFQNILKAEHTDGFPFIYWFTLSALQDTVLELLKHKIFKNVCTDSEMFVQFGYSLLASCASIEKKNVTEYILDLYSNEGIQNFCRGRKCSAIDETVHKEATPLLEAFKFKNEEVVRLLIRKKARFSSTSWSGWSFLHSCYEEQQICCLEILEAILAFDNSKFTSDQKDTNDALNYNQILAKWEKTFHEDVVTNIDDSIRKHGSLERILLDLVKIPNFEITSGLLDVFFSLSEIRKFSEMKLQNPLNITDENGNSILHLLVKLKCYIPETPKGRNYVDNSIDPVVEIVDEDMDEKLKMYPEEVTGEEQYDVVYKQMENQSVLLQMIRRLCIKGVDINMKNKKGETPLMIEISKYNPSPSVEIVKSLLHYKANPNAQDGVQRTCLHKLLFQNYKENAPIEPILDLLMYNGADINKTDKYGINPIFAEIQRKKPRTTILKILIDAQIDLSIVGPCGKTALHIALSSTYDEEIAKDDIIKTLLTSKSLNVLSCDEKGLSSFRIAMEDTEYNDVLKLIALHNSCPFPLHSCIVEDVKEDIKIRTLMHLTSSGEEKFNVSNKDQDGRTLLITAVQRCPSMVKLIDFLLTTHIDINARDTYGKNALFYLISSDTEFSVRETALILLLDKGPSVHEETEDGNSQSPLALAMQFITSRSHLFERLDPLEFPSQEMTKKITTEVSLEKDNTKKKEAQFYDFFDFKVEIVQKILDITTVNLNFAVDEKERTYLHYCASSRLADKKTRTVCEHLVRLGLEVDKKDKDGQTCIDMAFRYSVKNFDTLVFLLEKSRNLKELDIDGLLEFINLENCLYDELVRYLQQNIFPWTKPKRNLFQYLASISYDPKSQSKSERDTVFDGLLNSFPIDQKSKTGKIPLHTAIEENASVSCVRSFVRVSKCCINTPDSDGNTALHLIIKSDRDDTDVCTVVKKMLKCDVFVDIQNEMLETPIMLAVKCPKDRTGTITELLKAKTDLFLTDRRKYTILHHCIGAPKNDIVVSSLLSSFIDSDRTIPIIEKNTDGYTPLNLAAKNKKFSRILCILKLLEVKQCTAYTVDRQGRTPLFNTAFFLEGASPLVVLERLLRGYIFLMHGDSPSVTNNKGETVYDICNQYGHRHLENLLESEKSEKMFTIVKQAWIDVSSRYHILKNNDNDPKLQFTSNVEEMFRKLISDSLPFLSHVNFGNIKNVELVEEESNLSSVPDLEQETTMK